jgi:hypothetical protein
MRPEAAMSLRHARFFGLLVAFPLAACASSRHEASYAYSPPSQPQPQPVYGGVPGSYAGGGGGGAAPASASRPMAREEVTVQSTGDSSSEVELKGSSGPPAPSRPAPPTANPDVGGSEEGEVRKTATDGAAQPTGQGVQQQAPKEMLDIEANMTVAVDSVADAAKKVRELTKQYGGNLTGDQVQDEGQYQRGAFEIRVPSEKIAEFLDAIGGIGTVRSRDVRATDVSKQFFDSQILLHNLEVTMKRYEEILAQAKNVQEVLVVEQELTRLRGEINRVKGELRFMRDRVARSTLHLQIVPKSVDTNPPPENPEAKLYPGVRGTMLTDFTSSGHTTYWGFGLSIFIIRQFQIDVDLLRHDKFVFNSGGPEPYAFLVTAGGDIYSEFFGGGRRRYFNPYIGLRAGYARIADRNNALIAGNVGIELVRTRGFLLDLQARLHLFFGNPDDGAHAGIQPTLGLNVAF